MRLEALNHSELVCEKARIARATSSISNKVRTLGTDEGPEHLRYSATAGLDRIERIEQVGEIRYRLSTVTLPDLEKRRQQVDQLSEGYPRRLQEAEERFARMQGQPEKYSADELSLAEQALLGVRVVEIQIHKVEQLAPEVTAPPIISPTVKPPFKHLSITEEGRMVVTTILFEGSESRSKVSRLTGNEAMVLVALARARIFEAGRLSPRQLAAEAFNQTATEAGLNKILTGLRSKLNLEGGEFINSEGATRGPSVKYGIAEDVSIKSDQLQQEKDSTNRLNKLRKIVIERKGSKQAALFEKLIENLGRQVLVGPSEAAKELIHNLRKKLEDEIVDGFKYEIKTHRTKGRGLSYSLVEIHIPAAENIEAVEVDKDKFAEEVLENKLALPVVTPSPPAREPRLRETFEHIKRKDPQIVAKLNSLAAAIVAYGVRDSLTVPQIEVILDVHDHIVERAIEDRKVKVSNFEGHHGRIPPGEAVYLAASAGYEFNLTTQEDRDLRKLAKLTLATALREAEENGKKGKR